MMMVGEIKNKTQNLGMEERTTVAVAGKGVIKCEHLVIIIFWLDAYNYQQRREQNRWKIIQGFKKKARAKRDHFPEW